MPNNFITTGKISASQLSLWVKSPQEYIKQYLEGKPFIGNKYTEFGSLIHKKIELQDISMNHIPQLFNKEFYFEKKWNKVILNGYIDSFEKGEILDYKISKSGRWSQKDVENSIQVNFYGFWHYLEYKTLPKVSIVHIESIQNEYGELYLSGSFKVYTKQIRNKDIQNIKKKLRDFIKWCREYQNSKNQNKLFDKLI